MPDRLPAHPVGFPSYVQHLLNDFKLAFCLCLTIRPLPFQGLDFHHCFCAGSSLAGTILLPQKPRDPVSGLF